jgi:hypothetical protein
VDVVENLKVVKITRLLRCPDCGKRKALIKTEFSASSNLTTVSMMCAKDGCGKVFSISYKTGNKVAR